MDKKDFSGAKTTHRRPDVVQCGLRPLVAILPRGRMLVRESSSRGSHEAPGNVGAELEGDPDGDYEVDERDGVERDAPDAHEAHDGHDGEENGEDDDQACSPGAEEEGRDEEDGEKGEGEDFAGGCDDSGVWKRETFSWGKRRGLRTRRMHIGQRRRKTGSTGRSPPRFASRGPARRDSRTPSR